MQGTGLILVWGVLVVLPILGSSGRILSPDINSIKLSAENPLKNGTTYIISSVMDDSVITVHENGDVTTQKFLDIPEQRWTVVTHPLDPYALEFVQEVVPYNMLSGYEDSPENPGIFPRPLGLANRGLVGKTSTWNIKIRGRWCLQANGYGFPMDMDDCEEFVAPWQLWELRKVP